MKRFVLGFLVGVGLMYYYLNYGPTMETGARGWFDSAAAHYRDDQQHRAAREALGESEPPP
jgi:hypothetical protein